MFGPPRYIERVDVPIGKREPNDVRDLFMRSQLGVKNLFKTTIVTDDGKEFMRDHLGNTKFPDVSLPILVDAYQKTWGAAILLLLSNISPYRAHAQALAKLFAEWVGGDAVADLAREALFSGVGMYWTLRDSATFWQSVNTKGTTKPDVVKAWDLLGKKQTEFEGLRAAEFLGSATKVDASNQLYQVINTQACQLGVALTLGTLRQFVKPKVTVVDLGGAMAEGINTWMLSKTTGQYDRRLALARRLGNKPTHPWNLITNMDTPRAIQFRYFWLEILCSAEARPALDQVIDYDKVTPLRDKARSHYLDYVVKEKLRAMKTTHSSLTDAQRRIEAHTTAAKELRQGLLKWFSVSGDELTHWFNSESGSTAADSDYVEADAFDEESEDSDLSDEDIAETLLK
ncbi:hypothetical protein HMPREF0591_2088 [Mycobacterium parascrofulaceum ATCC BAA-614]|uniref:Uncharacterized protein n=1 Tax=Mycobacterium parascrofulaceum ATCC BAA-614 TaxID=525368 RepID=D5P7E4_9MYCO|nr:hypothetical protein HMPREF0591_2088 [Mycobacterium parascrofulaceum ATCC BAA-614]